jgi:hypothetical protein
VSRENPFACRLGFLNLPERVYTGEALQITIFVTRLYVLNESCTHPSRRGN